VLKKVAEFGGAVVDETVSAQSAMIRDPDGQLLELLSDGWLAVASTRHPHLTRERTQFVGQVRPGLVRWIGWDAQGRDRSALRTLGRLAVAFLSGLAAGAEHGCDLSPRMSVHAGLGHGIGQLRLAPGSSAYGIADAAQSTGIGIRRSNSRWVERVEPTLGGVGGLLELFAGSGHVHHLYQYS
jgi:hypothetical protein